MSTVFVNGRFLTQAVTGVQRFATEVCHALDGLVASGEARDIRLLVPPGTASPFPHLPAQPVGSGGGQRWEQLHLARAARGGVLLNLGNTAPLMGGARQAVVIHDAAVFDQPGTYSLAFRGWYRTLHRALPRLGTRIVTVSEFSRGRLAHHLGIEPSRIGVMAEGGEHILRDPADAAILARHGLAPRGYALTVGTRAAHKGLDGLREAVGLLEARGLRLAAAGAVDAGVFRPASGGEAAVALGRVTDAELRALYENALCLVFPSRYEGFGLPPVEAMWCGCPVLAAEAGAVPEVCGDAALWFDTDGPRTPAQAIASLLDEPGLADALREAGRVRATRYSWLAAARRLLSLVPQR